MYSSQPDRSGKPPRAQSDTAGWAILRVRIEPSEAVLTVQLEGELDAYSAGDLHNALREVEAGCTNLVIDLSGLTFLDCAGLHQIVEADRRVRERGGRLVLTNVSNAVRRVFKLTRLDSGFEFGSLAGGNPS